ncbi:MAG: hypothetical protein GY804_15510 [Alphaproteobacteria bacterium]|nr:hypothetical protein [Alphaproteobacteria bacterium]
MNKTDTMSVYFKVLGAGKAEKQLRELGQKGTLALDGISASTKPVNSALIALNSTVGRINKSMTGFMGVAGAYLGFQGLHGTITSIIDTNAELQKLSASMEVAEGSIDGANIVLEKLSNLATQTPYSLNSLTEAWIKLKNLGLKPSEEALLSYGNTSSAMGKDIMQFIEAIADASTMEFERLKEFGIKARQQGESVSFTFQGTTTTIKKNASEIEEYLRKLGQVEFAGAMEKQMATIGGASSNLSDNFIRLQKQIGDSKFNDSVQKLYGSISDVVSSSEDSAKSLGLALATVTDGVRKVVENIDVLGDAMVAFAGFKALQMGASGATITLGVLRGAFTSTARVGTLAMSSLSLAARGLSASVAMLGGPLGLITIAGFAIYEFTKYTDDAAEISRKYADELALVEKNTIGLTEATNRLTESTSRGKKLAILENIETIKEEISNVKDEMLNGPYWSDNWFTNQIERFNKDDVFDGLIQKFKDGKIGLRKLQDEILKTGEENPQYRDMALKFDGRLKAYKALHVALLNEEKKLANLGNPTIKPKSDDGLNKKNKEIKACFASMEDLKNSTISTKDLMNKFNISSNWQDGMLKGLTDVKNESLDLAKTAESAVKGSFKSMEDGIVSFVKTGKFQFEDFVGSILEGILRIQIQQAIIQPISAGLSGMFAGGSGVQNPSTIPTPTYSAGVSHSGGLAGGGVRRTVPLDVIANAPRYHVGSVIHQDEQAVITQKGEGIVSRQQMNELIRDKKRKNLGNVYVNVIHKSTGEKVKSEANVSEKANSST